MVSTTSDTMMMFLVKVESHDETATTIDQTVGAQIEIIYGSSDRRILYTKNVRRFATVEIV